MYCSYTLRTYRIVYNDLIFVFPEILFLLFFRCISGVLLHYSRYTTHTPSLQPLLGTAVKGGRKGGDVALFTDRSGSTAVEAFFHRMKAQWSL